MQKTLMFAMVAAFVAAVGFASPNAAMAKSDKASKAQDCAKIADAAKKKDCLAKANKGKATKADKAAPKKDKK